MRRLINLSTMLKNDRHRTWVGREARNDILWWRSSLRVFNGLSCFVSDITPPNCALYTDSCLEGGAGAYQGEFFYSNFTVDAPLIADMHISCKELYTVLVACLKWGHLWSGGHTIIFCDNSPSVQAINKGTSKNNFFMKCIREMHWLSVKFNFRITARHIPGRDNVLCDALSRLHDAKYFMLAKNLLRFFPSILARNIMSFKSFMCLQGCIAACRAC